MERIEEPAIKERTEKIIFRVKPEMKQFVKEFANQMNMDISDLMRMILNYFFMSYFTGEFNFQRMRERFNEMFSNKNGNQIHENQQ